MFPYLPDDNNDGNKALLATIESRFETAHPTIDLILRPPRSRQPERAILYASHRRGVVAAASLYLGAYADTYGADAVGSALAKPIDDAVVKGLAAIEHLCAPATSDECTSVFHDHPEKPIDEFAQGRAVAYLGYSEALHDVLRMKKSLLDALKQSVGPK